ncbi:MAG: electron transfer flavoprotein beta subunit/FixA family protein [Myxococcota bacterium]|nr:electron transfer flavoprotein beta subunit/FixA family protein [Myxococcota bacterium]
MRILICIKRVPAPGAKIPLSDDGQEIDTTYLGFTTSPHEECAVEEAVRIVEKVGGETTVLTLGPPAAEEQLRYAVSVRANKAAHVVTDTTDWGPERTASALTQAIRSMEAKEGPFDMVFFGNESADSAGYQVGIRVATAMGRPIVNGIKEIEVGEGSVTARRQVDGGFEEYELNLPLMLGIKEGINLPRYPTMKGRLASRKLAVTPFETTAKCGGLSKIELFQPKEQTSNTVVLGHGPEAAAKVVDVLVDLGVM